MRVGGLIVQTLRGGVDCLVLGSLRGKTSTVQVDGDGMDEGDQAEQCQGNVHLQTHDSDMERMVRDAKGGETPQ